MKFDPTIRKKPTQTFKPRKLARSVAKANMAKQHIQHINKDIPWGEKSQRVSLFSLSWRDYVK